jgi:hypothetical protein
LNKVIAYDETGFRGTGDTVYRTHAWEFVLAGGAVYSNLDYSFTPDTEDGSAPVTPPTPGGGGAALRKQLNVLTDFVHRFDFVRMKPDAAVASSAPGGVTVRALSEPGRQYALYFSRVVAEKNREGKETGTFSDPQAGQPLEVALKLPDGTYTVEWVDTRSGRRETTPGVRRAAAARLRSPPFSEDVALRVVRETER